jgi:hypothetical protein
VDTQGGESTERPVYTLCPLTRGAITLAVQESELAPEGFFTAIFETGVAELAAYPFTLRMLLREFASGQIHSHTHRMLYESYARALCDECYEGADRPSKRTMAPLERATFSCQLSAKALACHRA